jgi:hypothetical protein
MHGHSSIGLQLTPQATFARPQVVGESVSLGPAAVLLDRNANRAELSPSRFSIMHQCNSIHIYLL